MRTFASTAMPSVSTKPAMPGSVSVEPIIDMMARTSRPFSTSATSAMSPDAR